MTDSRDDAGNLKPDAERIIPVSRLIRRFRLDELPQLLSILRGQMAIIGPRPLKPETIEDMGEKGLARCLVRPGLTGWAQVSGNTRLSDEEKLALDLWYIAHRSVKLDLKIVAETFLIILVRGERRDPERVEKAISWLQMTESKS